MSGLKEVGNKIKEKVISAAITVSSVILATHPAFSLDGPFEKAKQATEKVQTNIVGLAKVLFPFSLVLLIVAILFTHDQKALQMELKTALIICVAYIALLIIVDSSFIDFFSGIF